jgi:uncharacterized protein with NRDE domain
MFRGVGAVSNADFHSPWPKLDRLSTALQAANVQNTSDNLSLLELLQDRRVAADEALPQTGIPIDFERALSAVFVLTPDYGTRASSVVRIHRKSLEFFEQSYAAFGATDSQVQVFSIAPSGNGINAKPDCTAALEIGQNPTH